MSAPLIGILCTHAEGNYQSRLLHACMVQAEQLGYQCVVLGAGPLHEAEYYDVKRDFIMELAGSWLEGVIIFGGALMGMFSREEIMYKLHRLAELPQVNVSCLLDGVPSIMTDNYRGMYDLVEHLIVEHGLRRIAFFPVRSGHTEGEERLRAYRDVLIAHGIPPDDALIVPGDVYPDAERGLAILIEERGLVPGSDFQALVLADEYLQHEIALPLHKRAIRIPADLRLAAFDHIDPTDPSYTMFSAGQALMAIGRETVNLLHQRIMGHSIAPITLVKPRLFPGTSCGCPDFHLWVPFESEWRADAIKDESELLDEVVDRSFASSPGVIRRQVPLLKDCLIRDLTAGRQSSESCFLSAANGLLAEIDASGTQDADSQLFVLGESIRLLTMFRREIAIAGFSSTTRTRADSLVLTTIQLFAEARFIAHEQLMRLHRRIDWRIRATVQHINAVTSRAQLLDQFIEHCLWLEIPNAALCLFDNDDGQALRVHAACLRGLVYPIAAEGLSIPDAGMLPEQFRHVFFERHCLVLPLYYQNNIQGYLVMAVPPIYMQDMFVYQTLRLVVSGALNSTSLIVENEKARQSAETANRAKGEFLARMSHELRTPLNGVLGFSELLLRDGGLNPDQHESVEIINNSGEYLLSLINDLLDLSRIEAQRLELFPRTFPLWPFINEVVQLISARASEKKLDFRFEWKGPEPETLVADDKRLRQILLNLLSNAVKFTQSGWVKFLVEASAAGVEGLMNFRFEVADNGPGIDEISLSRLFQPFEQAGDAASRSEGSGLGLVISQQLAVLMGSQIQVASAPGDGSRFWFSIELRAQMPSGNLPSRDSLPFARSVIGFEGAPRWILIADDNANNRHLIASQLEPLGFSLTQAMSGTEALDNLEMAMPDIILMDLNMPGLSGTDTVRAIRKLANGHHPVIIMISASANESVRLAAQEAGCNGYLSKPFSTNELIDCLGRHAGIQWRLGGHGTAEPSTDSAADLVFPGADDKAYLLELARSGKLPRIADYCREHLAAKPGLGNFIRQMGILLESFDGAGIIRLLESDPAGIKEQPGV